MIFEDDLTESADEVLARQARSEARRDAVLNAPEAADRGLLAFALALRLDLSAEHAVLYLREAPAGLNTASRVAAWVEAIPLQTSTETRQ
ncbi:hypothetical protein [Methylobacterium sp. CCH5-D2]|uniref:hypothetical protein n=1 Tax=Methylobacterium sp. CCH5-D2 TaxID=1768765 RepID=UPI0008300F01|nr:hypothetical protein [Methylobacterium sp. CCH5-D2]